ncbi:MAG: iron ABC transporter permease [Phycisphaerales bacterium]|nr:iron ABC transporter permease [Phycisphaerales bacterium]
MRRPSTAVQLGALAAAAVLVIAATSLLGYQSIGWRDVLGDGPRAVIYWGFRVPRTLLAAVAGAGLSVGGVILQSIFRNPLAEPYTVGVASGAALGAAAGFLAGWGGTALLGIPRLTLLAFAAALVTMGVVYVVYRLCGRGQVTRLLLAGLCVAYVCSSGILLATYLGDRVVTNDILVWTVGSLGLHRPRAALEILVILVPVALYALSQHRALDLLHLGEALAASRGVRVEATLWSAFAAVGVLTAAIVANCGPIAFVGLMVPHAARALVGPATLRLLVVAALLGAAFLALCDGLARSLVAELPVGVVTNILGAVFFLYLLARGGDRHAA